MEIITMGAIEHRSSWDDEMEMENVSIFMSRNLRKGIDRAAKKMECTRNEYVDKILGLAAQYDIEYTRWLQCIDRGYGMEYIPFLISPKVLRDVDGIAESQGRMPSRVMAEMLFGAVKNGWSDFHSMVEAIRDGMSNEELKSLSELRYD